MFHLKEIMLLHVILHSFGAGMAEDSTNTKTGIQEGGKVFCSVIYFQFILIITRKTLACFVVIGLFNNCALNIGYRTVLWSNL